MGRYPFLTVALNYLNTMRGVLAVSTHSELERRMRRMDKDLTVLKDAGKIKTCNPYKLNDLDVLAYISLLRSRGLQDSGIDHNLDALVGLLRYIGNGAVDQAKRKYSQHFPHSRKARLAPISDSDRRAIIEAAGKVPDKDWRRMLAYALCVSAICSGLRPKELRFAKAQDLNIARQVFHAEEVKGKGRYGEPRDACIHPDGLAFLRRYLRVRAKKLEKERIITDLLFPAIQDIKKKGDGSFSINGTTMLRTIVMRETGVKFDLRACRRTYGQVGIDDGVELDTVSIMLGHANTRTTETYYARKKNEAAVADARKVWGSNATVSTAPEANTPLIDKKSWISGYA
mgnify:CR=1 FL=1